MLRLPSWGIPARLRGEASPGDGVPATEEGTMRYMIHDQGRFIVKDTKENAQCPYLNRGRALVALTDGIGKSEIETLSREVLNHAPDVELREQVRILREALKEIHRGASVTGRWLDANGECVRAQGSDEHDQDTIPDDPEAIWKEYDLYEQNRQLETIAEQAAKALEATKEGA